MLYLSYNVVFYLHCCVNNIFFSDSVIEVGYGFIGGATTITCTVHSSETPNTVCTQLKRCSLMYFAASLILYLVFKYGYTENTEYILIAEIRLS